MSVFKKILIGLAAALLLAAAGAALFCALFRRPHREIVEGSGLDPALVYAVMKAESGFNEEAESPAGALGLMQLMPATAEFICRKHGVPFELERLKEGEYNTRLGCLYLKYLGERFEEETMIAAYNAGEGTVSRWLENAEFSEDGRTLKRIPYPETAAYVKKVGNLRKKYRIFYH